MASELKSCPFCGSPAQLMIESSYYLGGCINEECGAGTLWHVDETKAIEAWNHRALVAQVPEEIRRAVYRLITLGTALLTLTDIEHDHYNQAVETLAAWLDQQEDTHADNG